MLNRVDHLVDAVPDLERGMRDIEAVTGIRPAIGGQHPGRGTHNALVALGAACYLEIVAPDPLQPRPTAERWLGVDQCVAAGLSRMTTWAVSTRDLSAQMRTLHGVGIDLGEVRTGSRTRHDGTRLTWQLTDPVPLTFDGVVPFLIDWGSSIHPARTAPSGAQLVGLRCEHPDAARVERILQLLSLRVDVCEAAKPAIVATVKTPLGTVELR